MSIYRRKLMMAYAANLGRGDIVYPGLIAAWSAKGKSNDDEDRAILKDLTGNGHDITLNNFAYSGMSGYGGYKITLFDVHDGLTINSKGYQKINFSVRLDSSVNYKSLITIFLSTPNSTMPSFKLKISGLKENQHIGVGFHNYGSNIINHLSNGIHIVPSWTNNTASITSGITINDDTAPRQERIYDNVTIELIPEYPDALVFDGVDDYGVNESLPSLTDYTVISKIYWITSPNAGVYAYGKAATEEDVKYPSNICFSSYSSIGRDVSHLFNFGADTNVKSYVNPTINYHNTKVFNGIPINKGAAIDNNYPLHLGRIWANHRGLCNMAFYSFYLFNRTLTDEEIKSFIRKHIDPEYLLPSEIVPTPDVYYDFTNGDNSKGEANNVIKDLSGNGNDATARNFAWNEESGYSEGGIKV